LSPLKPREEQSAKKFIFKSMYSSMKSPYAVKITPWVPPQEATMTGLPINSQVIATLGQNKKYEIWTPSKNRAKKQKPWSRER